jgi:hypothetical protein
MTAVGIGFAADLNLVEYKYRSHGLEGETGWLLSRIVILGGLQ